VYHEGFRKLMKNTNNEQDQEENEGSTKRRSRAQQSDKSQQLADDDHSEYEAMDDLDPEQARQRGNAKHEQFDEEKLGAIGGEEEEGEGEGEERSYSKPDDKDPPPPGYVTLIEDFLRIATEARVVNTSDLDDEQLWNTLQQMERERAAATPNGMSLLYSLDWLLSLVYLSIHCVFLLNFFCIFCFVS
jgi:hypothetical protein